MSEKMLSYEEMAVSLLNEKYKDIFEIEKVQSHSIFRGFYTVMAYQADTPDLIFRADVDTEGTAVSDNYVSKLVCRRMSDVVAKNLDTWKGVYYIFTQAMTDPTMLKDTEISLEDYLALNPKNQFTINVNYFPQETDAEEIYSGFCNILKDLESISGKICLYIIDEKLFPKIQDYIETHDRCYKEYIQMTEEYQAGIFEFEKGTVKASKNEIMRVLENKL